MIEVKVKETMEEIGKAIKILEEARTKLINKKSFRPKDLRGGFVAYTRNSAIIVISASSYLNCDLAIFYENGEWRATKEGIERMLAYNQALQRIRAWKADNCEKREEGKDKFGIGVWSKGNMEVKSWHGDFYTGCAIGYFNSSKDAKDCMVTCHDDLLIVILDGYK